MSSTFHWQRQQQQQQPRQLVHTSVITQNQMPMTTKRSKSKPQVEFQYGGRFFRKLEVLISQQLTEIFCRNVVRKQPLAFLNLMWDVAKSETGNRIPTSRLFVFKAKSICISAVAWQREAAKKPPFLPERDYVTFGSLLSQFRLYVVCL